MRKFSTGRTMVLIATDVASRGIDVAGINCVINFDPPENGKAYKHRGGRTARAGTNGTVVSFVPKSKERIYSRIQREVGIKNRFTLPQIEVLNENEFELVAPEKEDRSDRKNRRGRSRGRNRISKSKRKFSSRDKQKDIPYARNKSKRRGGENKVRNKNRNNSKHKSKLSDSSKNKSQSRPKNNRKKSNFRS